VRVTALSGVKNSSSSPFIEHQTRWPPTSHRQLAAGEPLLLSYGPLSNDDLVMDYGFMIPENPHDRVAVRFDVGLLNVSGGWVAFGRLGWMAFGRLVAALFPRRRFDTTN
jgi:hypothetical protein